MSRITKAKQKALNDYHQLAMTDEHLSRNIPETFTCEDCNHTLTCQHAFDIRNQNGICMAMEADIY